MNTRHASTVVGETMKVVGELNLINMPRILQETATYSSQAQLPDCLSIDFADVTDIDSAAVSLLLHWRREALRLQKSIRYVNLPPNLESLAELYGVAALIHCPSQKQKNTPVI